LDLDQYVKEVEKLSGRRLYVEGKFDHKNG
jgi:hypothetical protein